MVFINTVSTLWANTVKLHVDNKKKDGGNSPFPWQSHILCFNRLFAAVKSVFNFMACQQCPCLNLSYSPFIPCNPSIHPSLCALLTKHLCSVFFFFFNTIALLRASIRRVIFPSSVRNTPGNLFFPLRLSHRHLILSKALCCKYCPSSSLSPITALNLP